MKILLSIYVNRKLARELTTDEPVVIGRCEQIEGDPPPINLHLRGVTLRLIVATHDDATVPRSWFSIEPVDDGVCRIRNLHSSFKVYLPHDGNVLPGQSFTFTHEALIDLGNSIAIRVRTALQQSDTDSSYRTLASASQVPGQPIGLQDISINAFKHSDAENVMAMIRSLLHVVQQAAGSDEFFQAAVRSTVNIVDLDRAWVLFAEGAMPVKESSLRANLPNGWLLLAQHGRETCSPTPLSSISTTLLNRAVESGNTVIHDPRRKFDNQVDLPPAESLRAVACAVASPIVNTQGEVIGVLYGNRTIDGGNESDKVITDLEATLVEVLAGAVSGGIALRAEERRRSMLSSFFSPTVASLLATNPNLMDGRDLDVTVLFCDIRGFSSVTEKLGPQKSVQWINDVMSELSQCVIDLDGVLVDYVGDELFAMWGAPAEQPDHARRAIDASKAMLQKIEVLRTRWNEILPSKFGAGIGINSGLARVGNVGSHQKFKYGPLGNTVNVGSRLQSATKQLGVDCVASRTTVESANTAGGTRRLATIGVVGIEAPIDVFQIVAAEDTGWRNLSTAYELALSDFENQQFHKCLQRLGEIMSKFPDDRPCRRLMSEAVRQLEEGATSFSAVWRLTSK